MKRKKLVLAAMSPAGTGSFSPVQVQKLFFILERNIGEQIGGPHFSFLPYDYGPFDSAVYQELERLQENGLIEVLDRERLGRRAYKLTAKGLAVGQDALSKLDEPIQTYICRLVEWVRALTFSQLVSAIYSKYPEMKQNSVFVREEA